MQNIENPRLSAYVGLIPAAGTGSRLPDRKTAKEMLPAGPSGAPVIGRLIQHMHAAGVSDITVVLRPQKRDLIEYLGDEKWHHIRFRLRFTQGTAGVPQTVALGLEGSKERNFVFGFPDILFRPKSVLPQMMKTLESGNADVVIGLFPAANPAKSDMVKTDEGGRVIDIEIKPVKTVLEQTWSLAVWRPAFTDYLSSLLQHDSVRVNRSADNPHDQQMGQIFQLAMADGMTIKSTSFHNGASLDIGTPADFALAQSWRD